MVQVVVGPYLHPSKLAKAQAKKGILNGEVEVCTLSVVSGASPLADAVDFD
jgi:hypothetical protein